MRGVAFNFPIIFYWNRKFAECHYSFDIKSIKNQVIIMDEFDQSIENARNIFHWSVIFVSIRFETETSGPSNRRGLTIVHFLFRFSGSFGHNHFILAGRALLPCTFHAHCDSCIFIH